MDCSDRKFWMENLGALLSSVQMVPVGDMSLEEQLNSITRLVFVVFVLMLLFNFTYSMHFLIISLLFIIILYYIQRRSDMQRKCQENYEPHPAQTSIPRYNHTFFPSKNEDNCRKGGIDALPYNVTYLTASKVQDGVRTTDIVVPQTPDFCHDNFSSDPPSIRMTSLNQNLTTGLTGGEKVNPKTLISPVVVPPAYNLEYWRDNNMIEFSQINRTGVQEDMYLSGYAESDCCGYREEGTEIVPPQVAGCGQDTKPTQTRTGSQTRENYCGGGKIVSPVPMYDVPRIPVVMTPAQRASWEARSSPQKPGFSQGVLQAQQGVRENYCGGGKIVSPVPMYDVPRIPVVMTPAQRASWEARSSSQKPGFSQGVSQAQQGVRENYCGGGKIVSPDPMVDVPRVPVVEKYDQEETEEYSLPRQNQSGWVNTSCGYNPEQLKVGLPSNYPAGNCEQSPALARFNENLFTQIVTPGVYTKSEVNEPINANIGISFQQQFEPLTSSIDEKGIHYTQHDPRVFEPTVSYAPEPQVARADNVYDPRFSGYGTSYRSYYEPVTGQTRFMYDDVNAIRMPNYITRSKIDFLPYADTYGPIQEGSEFGNVHNPDIRALAQDSWLRDSLQFRDDLTERMMRKVNAQAWQRRQAPLGPKQLSRTGGTGGHIPRST